MTSDTKNINVKNCNGAVVGKDQHLKIKKRSSCCFGGKN